MTDASKALENLKSMTAKRHADTYPKKGLCTCRFDLNTEKEGNGCGRGWFDKACRDAESDYSSSDDE